MSKRFAWVLSVFFLGFLPIRTFAQCKNQQDRHCWNLQYILYAAQTDFRELRAPKAPRLDASWGAADVPCHTDAWLNNVAMFVCNAELSPADSEQWYAKTMTDLRQLQYLWQFQVELAGTDHYVDAGPRDCEIAPQDRGYITDGPYWGQCPLHLQTVRQSDGSDEVFLWVNSYASPYLARNPYLSPSSTMQWAAKAPAPAPQHATPPVVATSPAASAQIVEAAPASPPAARESKVDAVCDELCQGLKKVLDDRRTAFKLVHGGGGAKINSNAGSSAATMRLFGSSNCSVNSLPSPEVLYTAPNQVSEVNLRPAGSRSVGSSPALQYVCYWPENSAATAEKQFRELVSVLQTLVPANWWVHEQSQTDELSGAKMTVWSVQDTTKKPVVRLYLSGESVGLHVDASD